MIRVIEVDEPNGILRFFTDLDDPSKFSLHSTKFRYKVINVGDICKFLFKLNLEYIYGKCIGKINGDLDMVEYKFSYLDKDEMDTELLLIDLIED